MFHPLSGLKHPIRYRQNWKNVPSGLLSSLRGWGGIAVPNVFLSSIPLRLLLWLLSHPQLLKQFLRGGGEF
nr:hypothetical protein Q903MT_gene3101 [Picea sitchensis]